MERDGDFWTRYKIQILKKLLMLYYEISKKHNLDLAQMSLKFLEIQPFVTSCYHWCNDNGAVEN